MKRYFLTLSTLLLFSCSERNGIVGIPPFLSARVELQDSRVNDLIRLSNQFAQQNALETEVVRAHFRPGDVSILLYSDTINITALNTSVPDQLDIYGVSRANPPSDSDARLVRAYIELARSVSPNQ